MWRTALTAALSLALALSPACRRPPAEPDPRLVIAADVPAYGAIARALAPDARIVTLIDPSVSPHTFNPAPSTVAAIAAADLILLNGLDLAPALDRQARSAARDAAAILTIADALSLRAEPHDHDHDHTHHDHHHHHAVDPHLWLDPVLMYEALDPIRGAIARAMQRAGASPDDIASLDRRRDELGARILALHDAFDSRLADAPSRVIVTHHDAFSRIADRYGLEVRAVIQPSTGVDPAPSVVDLVLRLARDGDIRAIFVEPQLPAGPAARLAELARLPLIELNPLDPDDYPDAMMRLLDALSAGLSAPAHNAAER